MESRKLIVVESPTKAKTLRKILDNSFIIRASSGHIADLPARELGIDIDNGFEPTYQPLPAKQRYITEISQSARNVSEIFLAPDPDREGEAIAWHLSHIFPHRHQRIFRVLFHEITKHGVIEAFRNPGQINMRKVFAQQARRIVDRLVGYKVSPLLWRKIRSGLSAGRVQSVAVRLICEREREIQAFIAEEYWVITAQLAASLPPPFDARLMGKGKEKIRIKTVEEAEHTVEELKNERFIVDGIQARERRIYPKPPFITSTLQQEAFRLYRFPAKKTMTIAQHLYEGKEIALEGMVGLITYMRTDSTRLSDGFVESVRSLVHNNHGLDYVPKTSVLYKNNEAAQDAHEAIRPTDITRLPSMIQSHLSVDEAKIYDLIWRRTLACQMSPAIVSETLVDITAGPYHLQAKGTIELFDGFRAVYREISDEQNTTASRKKASLPEQILLPKMIKGDILDLLDIANKQQFTQPPPRFTEATLIKELEKNGIGRPSTYATIMDKIRGRDYTSMVKDRFVPTDLGFQVIDMLVEKFPHVFSVSFTAGMEKKLDDIEAGKVEWRETVADFFGPFNRELKAAYLSKSSVEQSADTRGSAPIKLSKATKKRNVTVKAETHVPIASSGKIAGPDSFEAGNCPLCGGELRIRKGKYGPFWSCSHYPDCTFTRSSNQKKNRTTTTSGPGIKANAKQIDESPQKNAASEKVEGDTDRRCPLCGAVLRRREGANGDFMGCSSYPECSYTGPVTLSAACPRPGCDGVLIKRRVKSSGITFYGCSRYPVCTETSNREPVLVVCPHCQHRGAFVLVEKPRRILQCMVKTCHYQWEEKREKYTPEKKDEPTSEDNIKETLTGSARGAKKSGNQSSS